MAAGARGVQMRAEERERAVVELRLTPARGGVALRASPLRHLRGELVSVRIGVALVAGAFRVAPVEARRRTGVASAARHRAMLRFEWKLRCGMHRDGERGGRESILGVAGRTLAEILRAHLGSLKAGDYFALLAYLEMTPAHEALLTAMRVRVRDQKRVATCLGFGPRFLHSTGQAYKGGPNTGVFLQITSEDARDVPIPGQKYTFGIVKAAQARGDLAVLRERGRRALRIHLTDVDAGLRRLAQALEVALS